jgi:hypothetical protein
MPASPARGKAFVSRKAGSITRTDKRREDFHLNRSIALALQQFARIQLFDTLIDSFFSLAPFSRVSIWSAAHVKNKAASHSFRMCARSR